MTKVCSLGLSYSSVFHTCGITANSLTDPGRLFVITRKKRKPLREGGAYYFGLIFIFNKRGDSHHQEAFEVFPSSPEYRL